MMQNNLKKIGLVFVACVALAACETAQSPASSYNEPLYSAPLQKQNNINEATLKSLEKSYKNDPQDDFKAVRYANALRHLEYLNRASIILKPLTDDPNSPADAKSEFAAVQLELGNYAEAQTAARKAIGQKEDHFEAYHYLGIALDAEGNHVEAEEAFRKGLEIWQGDPTMIMNNLALNLASQERLDDAIAMLENARDLAPHRQEIERNLRIITALKEAKG